MEEEIELLEIEPGLVKKDEDNKIIDNQVLIKEKSNNNKKKLKKWEKWFVILNIIVIIGLIGLYLGRAIYYYNEFNVIKTDNRLYDVLVNNNNITYTGDGLYMVDDLYYFRGINVNNYVYYSGRLFRIVSISDKIKLISDDIDTSLVWGYDSDYKDSYINKWLNNNYYNGFLDNEIVMSNWCNNFVDINNYSCDESINENIGLLSVDEYIRALGSESYLNINKYWWTINYDNEKMVYYVNNEGTINNVSHSNDTYHSYGVRPVINLSLEIEYLKGDGSKNNPFVISEEGKALLSDNSIGSYINYGNYLWRISDKKEGFVKLIMDGVLEDSVAYSKINTYLNNDFLKNFNKNELVKCDYNTTEYSNSSKYDYSINRDKVNNYVGIPSVGDLFINDNYEYWLYNKSNTSTSLAFKTTNVGSLYGDLMSNKNNVKPVICVKNDLTIKEGNGQKDNPLVVGE